MRKSRKDQLATGTATTWRQVAAETKTAVFRLADGRRVVVRNEHGVESFSIVTMISEETANELLNGAGVRADFTEPVAPSSGGAASESAQSVGRRGLHVLP